MTGPNGETHYLITGAPRGAHWVKCPQCSLGGWHEADDCDPPMVCPHCAVTAVHVDPEAAS